ncbi:hypothetical protein EHN06_15650 [Marinobacter sp. NP-4(2019)]|uniref:hypothetical protein n=1 Tax=Marinobacter sp. NP-4(2019) TaxID=2488665 RepID=UPI000FC3CB5F|nr:hypothetical protein [Marinobacter sp. NP-4(2019)]AZT84871.1 hypothetical protein EHN06_15650 [Marinobacter sp. NP-4(2019)]
MKILLALLISFTLTACVQTPTRNTEVVDDRPGIAFELPSVASEYYKLRIDGVSYGYVGQYQAGENLLKIIDGTHQVELLSDGEVVYHEEIYLGAGVNRILKVGPHD